MTQTRLTIKQLAEMDWTIHPEVINCTIEEHLEDNWDPEQQDTTTTTRFDSAAYGDCTARCEDLTIHFAWGARGVGMTWGEAHTWRVELDGEGEEPEIVSLFTTVLIVDEKGEEIENPGWALFRLLNDDISWEGAVRALLPSKRQTEDIDMTEVEETTDIETITVERDDGAPIRFRGEQIGYASSSAETCRSDYSGSVGRWCELTLYKTAGGKYVCSQIGRTQWQGEHDRCTAAVCETVEQVTRFFGFGWLAKELYESAGLDVAEEIE